MVLSVYKSAVLLIFGLIFTGSLHAEPVLVLGSFSDQKNAASHIQRVENRLGKPAYVGDCTTILEKFMHVFIFDLVV